MADGYTKLFASITDSTIWEAPDTTRLVWITMLAMADQDGYVGASVPGLAARARVSLEDCVRALETFKAPDEWSRSRDFEGRRIVDSDGGWLLLNHAKYRAIRDAEARREQARLAMARLRAERKGDKPVTDVNNVSHGEPPLAHTEAEANTEARSKARARPSVARPPDVEDETWQDWLSLRKAKRAPVTATVVKEARAEAEKAGMPLTRFLEIWCSRGSQGLQAEWLKPDARGQNQPVQASRTRSALDRLQSMKIPEGNNDNADMATQRDSGRPQQAALPAAGQRPR